MSSSSPKSSLTARAEGVDLTGPGGLLTGLTKPVLETALETDRTRCFHRLTLPTVIWGGSYCVRGLAMRVIGGEVGERQRASGGGLAGDQVSAAGVQCRPQCRGDHLQVGDLGLGLDQLGC